MPRFDQPGAEVHARLDDRPGARHQRGAVAPCQPHLLTAGVETDRQPGQDPVVAVRTAHSVASASTKAAAARWLTATPLGVPVDPEVKMTQQSSAGLQAARRAAAGPAGREGQARTDDGANVGVAPHLFRPGWRVGEVHRHVARRRLGACR